MSVIVAKMFEADMSEFQFVFSQEACIKTIIYFAIMYLAVMFFNTITISKYKLIDLLHADKKNEKVKLRNPILAIFIFIIGTFILGYAYYLVTKGVSSIKSEIELLVPIILGIVSTILIFWAFSGFLLKTIQMMKRIYYKGTNMFILRQLNNKINTTVISMSVICLMLFMTITILSSSLSLRVAMAKDMEEMTPVDINLYKTANLKESTTKKNGEIVFYSKEKIENSKIPLSQTLENCGLDMNVLKDTVEIPIYKCDDVTTEKFFGKYIDTVKPQFPYFKFEALEEIVKISDYNKIAKLYGIEEYELNNDEYIMLCNFEGMKNMRNIALKDGDNYLEIAGEKYKSKYNECKEGFIVISTSHSNIGIILVPDSCNLEEEDKDMYLLAGNFNAKKEEEKEEIHKIFADNNSELLRNLAEKDFKVDGMTKITIIESSVGVATIVTFIAIYLGLIFLIASSAILALKQLTVSTDNKERYEVLRRIGCDEKMINKSLFWQIRNFLLIATYSCSNSFYFWHTVCYDYA